MEGILIFHVQCTKKPIIATRVGSGEKRKRMWSGKIALKHQVRAAGGNNAHSSAHYGHARTCLYKLKTSRLLNRALRAKTPFCARCISLDGGCIGGSVARSTNEFVEIEGWVHVVLVLLAGDLVPRSTTFFATRPLHCFPKIVLLLASKVIKKFLVWIFISHIAILPYDGKTQSGQISRKHASPFSSPEGNLGERGATTPEADAGGEKGFSFTIAARGLLDVLLCYFCFLLSRFTLGITSCASVPTCVAYACSAVGL